jgi:hypothetical protein
VSSSAKDACIVAMRPCVASGLPSYFATDEVAQFGSPANSRYILTLVSGMQYTQKDHYGCSKL